MYKSLMLAGVLALASPFAHAEKIDCESMAQIATALDQIAEGMDQGAPIDDDLDAQLGEVIDALQLVAEAEQNSNFDNAINELTGAYNDMDRDGFIAALDRVNELFAAFYIADCDA